MKGQIIFSGTELKAQMGLGCLLKSGGLELVIENEMQRVYDLLEKDSTKLVLFNFGKVNLLSDEKRQEALNKITLVRNWSEKPVVVVGENMDEMFRILVLNCGADDCIDESCNPLELTARISAQIRCYDRLIQVDKKSVICLEGLEVDDQSKMVKVEGHLVDLTPTEYKILHLLMEEPGRVFSNKQIYEKIWKMAPIGADNTVAVHVRHIREKIESNPQEPKYLRVVWGQGYKVG